VPALDGCAAARHTRINHPGALPADAGVGYLMDWRGDMAKLLKLIIAITVLSCAGCRTPREPTSKEEQQRRYAVYLAELQEEEKELAKKEEEDRQEELRKKEKAAEAARLAEIQKMKQAALDVCIRTDCVDIGVPRVTLSDGFQYSNGDEQTCDSKRMLDKKGAWKQGKKVGPWVRCERDGDRFTYQWEEFWVDGERDGTWTNWRRDKDREWSKSDGIWRQKSEENYKRGKKHGTWVIYQFDGETVQSSGNYLDDKEHGTFEAWGYAKGHKQYQGQYENGVKEGQWTYWDENGEVTREENYKRGGKHGTWSTYLVGGQSPVLVENYVADKKHGASEKWDPATGNKLHQGQYENGVKEGRWTYWAENGKVTREENYKSDTTGQVTRAKQKRREGSASRNIEEVVFGEWEMIKTGGESYEYTIIIRKNRKVTRYYFGSHIEGKIKRIGPKKYRISPSRGDDYFKLRGLELAAYDNEGLIRTFRKTKDY
jgi:antitoxin component YwqK of YwqJK toxin-antitoxin module